MVFTSFKPWWYDSQLPLKCLSIALYFIYPLFDITLLVLLCICCIQINCTHIVVSPKFLFPNLYFKFACRLHSIIVLFSFKYPINDAILIFDDILPKDVDDPMPFYDFSSHLHKFFIIFWFSSPN